MYGSPPCCITSSNNGGVRVAEARSPSIQLCRLILIPQAHRYVSHSRYDWALKRDENLVVALVGRANGTSMIRFAKLKCREVCQLAPMAVATLALLVATGNFAEAGSS